MQASLLVWGILQSLDFAWCNSCVQAQDYVCKEIPTRYPAGLSSVVLFVNNVGEINTTVFNDTNLASVTSLTMTRTGITAIAPGAFDKFHHLRTLNLHDNDLSQVTSTWFTHKEVLENLALSNNSIEALNDDSFRHLLGLLRLNLSQNQISTITTGSFRSMGKLRHLDLSNNRLTHLSVETLLPVNTTKVRLDGNPWDCSCAVQEFAIYLRDLQNASLLENQMEVLCDSPESQRGVPVWNVSQCETTTTGLDHTVTNTLQPPSDEGAVSRATLISLIVLYHRKRVRKHLLAIQPSSGTLERAKQPQTDCREGLENSTNVESVVAKLKKNQPNCSRTVALLSQRVPEPEKVSQIYQIYGTGMCQMRETAKRAKSAGPVLSTTGPVLSTTGPVLSTTGPVLSTTGPVLSTTGPVLSRTGPDVFGRWPEAELGGQADAGARQMQREETEKHQRENGGDDREDRRREMAASKKERGEWEKDEEERASPSELENKYPQLDGVDCDNDSEELNALEAEVKYNVNLMIEDGKTRGNSLMEKTKQEYLHSDDESNLPNEQGVLEVLTSSSARHQPHQEGSDDFLRPLEDAENMPYLTIGTDPETQSPNQEQMSSEAAPEQMPSRTFRTSRPFRRVLTWPPTATQWKKHWAQNQQILNMFSKLTAITERTHQDWFTPHVFSDDPENIPQGSGAGHLPVHKSQSEEDTVETVKSPMGVCESVVQSCAQNVFVSSEDKIGINESWLDVSSHPALKNEAHSDLVISNPLYKEMLSKAESEKFVNPTEDSGNETMGKITPKNEPSGSKSKRQLGRTDGERRNPLTKGQNDQVHSSCDSAVPPAGGSPSDDNLLVDNEYAFIDLLHEVVENRGRWTRERWRQTHRNKQKWKQFGVIKRVPTNLTPRNRK
ncbi:uncharacterized protein LOC143509244 isoform X2 [Brachyhypopomus gauderio]|uniref:uncharacterized protein LOC143509244 isoform X2 n=1 Tax=Brachyhypopomus gauderio TaxID=698409 RepID=UPI004041B3BE